jgi:hypothetical protein
LSFCKAYLAVLMVSEASAERLGWGGTEDGESGDLPAAFDELLGVLGASDDAQALAACDAQALLSLVGPQRPAG